METGYSRMLLFCISVTLLMATGGSIALAGQLGLAAKYPGDVGIDNDPRVVFFDSFEAGEIADLPVKWGHMSNKDGKVISFSADVPSGVTGERSLQMTATKDLNAGGELYKTFSEGWDQIYLRFYTKFAEDIGNYHHFVALRGFLNPSPIPLGGAGNRPEDFFSITIEPTVNERNSYPSVVHAPPGVWQFYAYWPEMRSWQTVDGKSDGRANAYYGNTFMPVKAKPIARGQWTCVEFMVKLNSSPEAYDGELAMWIDGELAAHFAPGTPKGNWSRDQYRNDPNHAKSVPFAGFRWRTDMDLTINVLRLQHYVSGSAFNSSQSYAEKNPDYLINSEQATVWFDNVVMATEYIGPMVPVK